eukprot:GILI01013282.1.p1 GENE.GILI01013282.1~~GILI01013282.1.p1  ORF type:complete len:312 (+),score=76.80 GILI01013282.1:48-983(+)
MMSSLHASAAFVLCLLCVDVVVANSPISAAESRRICRTQNLNVFYSSYKTVTSFVQGALQPEKAPLLFRGNPLLDYKVVNTVPHDPTFFTEGLFFEDSSTLIESTGLLSKSVLARVDASTGQVLQQTKLDPDIFGEGVTAWKDRFVMLTYKNSKILVFNKDLQLQQEVPFTTTTGEGWGITHDKKHLIVSDGSNTLQFLDPKSFAVVKSIKVRDGQSSDVTGLNELEYIKGEIWANVWPSSLIVRINPSTGYVKGWLDLGSLLPSNARNGHEDCLNGIAYDASQERVFLTGKNWPYYFYVDVTGVEEESRN